MKLPPNRIDSFVRRPDPGIRAVLLYGPDAGAVRDHADTLARGVIDPPTDPFRVAELASAEIGRDPARLVDEVFALSLIGGRRLVRVRDASDAVAPALEAVLKGGETDTLVVLEADELTPRSALRKLAEGADGAAAIACYMPDEEAIGRFIHRLLAEAKVSADGEAEQLLAASLVGDRQIARREVEKLIAYVGDGGPRRSGGGARLHRRRHRAVAGRPGHGGGGWRPADASTARSTGCCPRAARRSASCARCSAISCGCTSWR